MARNTSDMFRGVFGSGESPSIYVASLIPLVPLGRQPVRALPHVLHRNWQGENQEVSFMGFRIRKNLQCHGMQSSSRGLSKDKVSRSNAVMYASDQGWGPVVGRSFVSGRWTMEEQQCP